MNAFRRFQITMALVSSLGFIFPSSVVLGATATPTRVQDVSMDVNGKLQGKVMDTAGKPVAGATVRVQQAGKVVGEAVTNNQGSYDIAELRGGVYQVSTAGATFPFRVWASKTAPPHATQAALLITKAPVVRGQCCTETANGCCGGCEPAPVACGTCDGGCGCGGDSCTSCRCDSCNSCCGGEACGCGGGCCGEGCCGCSSCGRVWPWVVAAGAAAAIAIPLAIDDDDDNAS